MDTWQDLIIIYLCEQTLVGSSSRGIVASQAVLDTLGKTDKRCFLFCIVFRDDFLIFFFLHSPPNKQTVPKTRDFNYDRIVIQTKADALLLTDEEYSWFAYQQQVRPSAWNRGRQFCFALIKLLENANVIISKLNV